MKPTKPHRKSKAAKIPSGGGIMAGSLTDTKRSKMAQEQKAGVIHQGGGIEAAYPSAKCGERPLNACRARSQERADLQIKAKSNNGHVTPGGGLLPGPQVEGSLLIQHGNPPVKRQASPLERIGFVLDIPTSQGTER